MVTRFLREWKCPRVTLSIIVSLVILAVVASLPFGYLSARRTFEEVTIPADGYQLHGYLSPGKAPGSLWVVFLHGNRRDGQSAELYQKLRNNLPEEVGVLAVDMRGFGNSSHEGMAQAARILDRSEDLEAAVDYLATHEGVSEGQIVLMGHSLGAYQVMTAAHQGEYKLAIPIGIGNWDIVLSSPEQVQQYVKKFADNTGVRLTSEDIYREAPAFTPGKLFSGCPQTPIIVIYGSREETRTQILPYYQEAKARCGEMLQWLTIPLADHMFATEITSLPGLFRQLLTNLSLSILKVHLTQLLSSRAPVSN